MPINKKDIETSLLKKGFTSQNTHNKYFYFEYEGKTTGICTYYSHGKPKDIPDSLLRMMKKQLKLDTLKEAKDLFLCPMSEEEYIEKLKNKNLL